MRKLIMGLVVVLCLGVVGCAGGERAKTSTGQKKYKKIEYKIETSKSTYSDSVIEATLIPAIGSYNSYDHFEILIKNKSKKDLKIIWDESYFLEGSKANGGFMFDGVRYADRNSPKQPDLILPESDFSKRLFPNNRVEYLRPLGWVHMPLKDGVFGVYICLAGDKYSKKVKLLVEISSYEATEEGK